MAADSNPVPTKRKRRVRLAIAIGITLVALFIIGARYLTGPSFNAYVRGKLVESLNESTGGHAVLPNLRWNLSKLEFEAHDLTLRGTERADDIPLAHADRLYFRLKVFSLLKGDFGISYIEFDRPTIHLITYPDGTTNVPVSQQKATVKPVDELFHLAVDRAEIRDGLIYWNNKPAPLDLTANDVAAFMTYSSADTRYDGKFNFGKLDIKFQDMRPLAADAEIDFSMLPRSLTLKAFRMASGVSNVEASGRLDNFDDPIITLTYNSSIDIRQAGVIMRNPELHDGELQLNGTGRFTQADYIAQGHMLVKKAGFDIQPVRLTGVDAGATFVVTKDRLDVNNLFAHAFGGAVTGEAKVLNWAASPLPGPGGKPSPRHGTAHLRVSGMQVARAANSLSQASMPVSKAQMVGAVGGKVELEWFGPMNNAIAQIALDVAPPSHPKPEQIPVNARLRASFNTGRSALDVAQLDVSTRATRLHAAGSVGRTNSSLKVTLNTTSLDEFKPAIAAFGGPARLPVVLSGSAAFNGLVTGTLAAPNIAGHLDVQNFDSVFDVGTQPAPTTPRVQNVRAPAAAPAAAPREMKLHWDRLVGDVQYSMRQASLRNVSLQRGKMRITAAADATLLRGKFTDNSPFKATVNLSNTDLADMQAVAGYNYPITGTANASLVASGTINNPRATGKLQITGATYKTERISSLTGDFKLADHVAELSNLTLVNAGRITGNAAYNLQNKTFRFDLRGAGVDLAKLPILQTPRATIAGLATFSAQGSGTMEAPSLNANLRIESVVINGETVGNIQLDAVTRGEEVRLTGSTRYQNAQLLLNGTVRLRDAFAANVHLHLSNLDVDPLLRAYLQGRITGHSSVAGDLQIEGPLQRPRELNVNGTITQLSAELESIKLKNEGPIRFSLANQQLRLDQLKIVGDGTELAASGTAMLNGTRQLNMTANGHLNLQLIETVNPAYNSGGQITLAVTASGTIDKPSLAGRVQITDGAISYIDLPNGLAGINGTLVFNQDRLQVESLVAHTGGGALQLGGFIAYSNGVTFNLTAQANDIRLRYPPGVSAGASADLRLTGTLKNSTLSGDVTVLRFGLNPRFDFSLYLARANQPPTLPDPTSPLNNLHLDVHVVSTPALEVQTSIAKLSGDVDLRLRGTGTRPVVLGRVNIIEGDIFFNGTTYHLERGDISFSNPVRIDPVLNVEATARVRDYDITLGVHGPIDHLATNYRSEPPLPTGDIIALLAFGHTQQDAALNPQAAPNFTETASNAILGEALNQVVSSRAQKLFGASRIKIDPQVGTATSNPTARITIEQQISGKLTLTYITDVTQSSQQVIQFEYNVNRNVSVTAVRDQYGVVGFDVKIRQRRK